MTLRHFPIAFAAKHGRNLAQSNQNKGVFLCLDVI